jgi:hypothetical protein
LLPLSRVKCLIPQRRLQRMRGLLTPIVAGTPRSPDLSAFPALSLLLVTAELRQHSN